MARERDNWCTPEWLCRALGPFDLDPCSNEFSHVRAHRKNVWDGVVGSPTDGLALDVPTDFEVFVNPPYSDTLRWVRKWAEHRTVFLLRWDPSTRWFHHLMPRTYGVWFPDKRLAFEPPPGVVASTNQFPHALYFTDKSMFDERREAFAQQEVHGTWWVRSLSMAPDLRHTVTLRPRRGGRRHLMLGGALGEGRTLCGRKCGGWVVSPDPADCKLCLNQHEINQVQALEAQSERIRGHDGIVIIDDPHLPSDDPGA